MLPTEAGKRLYTQIVEAIERLESITPRSSEDLPQLIRIGSPQEFFAERILNQLPQAENLWYRVQFGLAKDLIRRFWRVVFGRRLDTVPKLVLPALRMIRQAVVAGLGFSVLPDYLCEDEVNSNALKLILKPTNAVSNQIWLSYRKSERQSPRIELLRKLTVDR